MPAHSNGLCPSAGDWFNRLDYTLHDNNFGVGLPPAAKNRESWDWKRRLLAEPQLKPSMQAIQESQEVFLELLRIRYSTPLLRLPCAQHIHNQLTFLNTGPDQVRSSLVPCKDGLLQAAEEAARQPTASALLCWMAR